MSKTKQALLASALVATGTRHCSGYTCGDRSRIWVRGCSTLVAENRCFHLPFILIPLQYQNIKSNIQRDGPVTPGQGLGRGHTPGKVRQHAAIWNPAALVGAWAGASTPEHQGRREHCLAPRGGPGGGQGQGLAGHNNNLCLRFDLFSVASSRVKRSASNRLISFPFFCDI